MSSIYLYYILYFYIFGYDIIFAQNVRIDTKYGIATSVNTFRMRLVKKELYLPTMRRVKLFLLVFENFHVSSTGEQGSYRDISLMDSYGIALYVIGADVVDSVTDLDVHIAIALFEAIGEVL